MKNLKTGLTILLLLFSVTMFAQPRFESDTLTMAEKDELMMETETPGNLLIIASNRLITSIGVGIGGTILTTLVATQGSAQVLTLYVLGGVTGFATLVFTISGYNYLKMAGIIMNKRNVGTKIPKRKIE